MGHEKNANTGVLTLSGGMASCLDSPSVSCLRKLYEGACKFYNSCHLLYDAALLARCYTQHDLKHYLASNHLRYFIQTSFRNKGSDLIGLSSIVFYTINQLFSCISLILKILNLPLLVTCVTNPLKTTALTLRRKTIT